MSRTAINVKAKGSPQYWSFAALPVTERAKCKKETITAMCAADTAGTQR